MINYDLATRLRAEPAEVEKLRQQIASDTQARSKLRWTAGLLADHATDSTNTAISYVQEWCDNNGQPTLWRYLQVAKEKIRGDSKALQSTVGISTEAAEDHD